MKSTKNDHPIVQNGNQYLGWTIVSIHVEMGAPMMMPMLK